MNLEIRSSEGVSIAVFSGEAALVFYEKFSKDSSMVRTQKDIKDKGKFEVFKVIEDMKISFDNGLIKFWLWKDSYVKILV